MPVWGIVYVIQTASMGLYLAIPSMVIIYLEAAHFFTKYKRLKDNTFQAIFRQTFQIKPINNTNSAANPERQPS